MKNNNKLDEIIENKLWLGNYSAAEDINDLKNKKITKILTIMNEDYPKYKEEDGFIHKKFEVMDVVKQNIIQYFGECLNFIKGEEKVLVHCKSGASRSATIVIAYLMWTQKMRYNNAMTFTKDKRFIVLPNRGFREQLKMFDKLLIDNDYDIDKINFKEIKWEPPEDLLYRI